MEIRIDPAHARLFTGHTDERSFRRYTLAIEQEAAIEAFYRAKGEGQSEAVVYAKGLSQEQRQLLKAFTEMTGIQALHQDELDKGEITFAELWQENLLHLERMVAAVWELPQKLGVQV